MEVKTFSHETPGDGGTPHSERGWAILMSYILIAVCIDLEIPSDRGYCTLTLLLAEHG